MTHIRPPASSRPPRQLPPTRRISIAVHPRNRQLAAPAAAGLILGLLCVAAQFAEVRAQTVVPAPPLAAEPEVVQPGSIVVSDKEETADEAEATTVPAEALPYAAPHGASIVVHGYSSYEVTDAACPPRPPTCTSCADHTGCNDPLSRLWNHRVKPFLQETHWGYCEHFDDKPFGASLRQGIGTQIAEGRRSQMVLYQFDFRISDGASAAELNDRGHAELDRMVHMMGVCPSPIVIEYTPGAPHLDAQRQAFVRHELQRRGVPATGDHVLVGRVERGLMGVEAIQIYNNLLRQTQMRGAGMTTESGGEAPTMGVEVGG